MGELTAEHTRLHAEAEALKPEKSELVAAQTAQGKLACELRATLPPVGLGPLTRCPRLVAASADSMALCFFPNREDFAKHSGHAQRLQEAIDKYERELAEVKRARRMILDRPR